MGIWKNLGMGGYRGFSRPAARLLQQAVQLAGDLGCEQADTGHLLLAMLQQRGAAAQFLTRKNITEPEVRRQLAQRRSGPAQRLDRRAMAPDTRKPCMSERPIISLRRSRALRVSAIAATHWAHSPVRSMAIPAPIRSAANC